MRGNALSRVFFRPSGAKLLALLRNTPISVERTLLIQSANQILTDPFDELTMLVEQVRDDLQGPIEGDPLALQFHVGEARLGCLRISHRPSLCRQHYNAIGLEESSPVLRFLRSWK